MAIGDRLKELRVRKGQSLQQVSYAIGASKAHIWELENKKSKNPSLDMLQKLASHFNTSVSYLIEEPEHDASRAAEFFQRNADKLAALDDTELAIVEQLLNVIAKSKDGR